MAADPALLVPVGILAGATGIVSLIIRMILTGRLVPGTTHTEMMQDKDRQIAAWRDAAQAGDRQVDALLEVGHVAEQVFRALPVVEPSGEPPR